MRESTPNDPVFSLAAKCANDWADFTQLAASQEAKRESSLKPLRDIATLVTTKSVQGNDLKKRLARLLMDAAPACSEVDWFHFHQSIHDPGDVFLADDPQDKNLARRLARASLRSARDGRKSAELAADFLLRTPCYLEGFGRAMIQLAEEILRVLLYRDAQELHGAFPRFAHRPEQSPPELRSHKDGFVGVSCFEFRNAKVDFGRAKKQYALMRALWDAERGCPSPPRDVLSVIQQIDCEFSTCEAEEFEDSSRGAFRVLCAATRKRLEKQACPITVQERLGTIQLVAVSIK